MNEEDKKLASEVVNEFIAILEPWFYPDDKWERIEKTADEFLFEGTLRALTTQREKIRKIVEGIQKRANLKTMNYGGRNCYDWEFIQKQLKYLLEKLK